MPIHFIVGKPGGGKSLLATRRLVEELIHGSRPIVTNLPLVLPGINNYLIAQFKRPIDVTSRIQLIDETQSKCFYQFRGPGNANLTIDDKGIHHESPISISSDRGVLYIIDEAHLAFNSRDWKTIGRNLLFYASQHRKLNDDIILVTQHWQNVDKQFRVLAESYTITRNFGKESWFGFRLPKRFLIRETLDPPTSSCTISSMFTMNLDVKGLCSCYRTGSGVGVLGLGDTERKQRGMPWYLIPVILPILALVVWYIITQGPKAAFAKVTQPQSKISATPMPSPSSSSNRLSTLSFANSTNQILVNGFSSIGPHKLFAFLSDGRTLTRDEILYVSKSFLLDRHGKSYPFAFPSNSSPVLPTK